ncbi:hypothetical protein VB774_08220 [Pseudanabaena galeata UHCC 0370]|uniref:Uncharacterized protein n=1 Tax=Pseudanabaena galeata UHCC 0370 TaxID=3110310 RepID=A0ABU5THI7_9CYAN|nr:hypothetical protein [Pseudanabaena galeata]MEA5477604.1 hypothetical protein [Pseudanabaena galeata UHCC 0370]
MSRAKSPSPSGISTQSIVWAAIGWAALALMFYLFFNAPTDGPHTIKPAVECDKAVTDLFVRPNWYRYGTYIFQTVAIACSGILCLRNWRSSKIISGRNVWLGLGIGILSWGIGNLIFGYLDFQYQSGLIAGGAKGARDLVQTFPSIADIFFTATYVFLSWGMAMSVIGRRLNLYPKQWAIVGAVGFTGVVVAAYVTFGVGGGFSLDTGKILNIIYALGDIWLLIVATILLLAFWGGKAAQSWRLLGSAGIAMFFGDLWFNYSINTGISKVCEGKQYQSGEPAEFFWILAFILWGMAAALEFDLSSRPTSRSRRS